MSEATELVIDGFTRSASTFAVVAFQLAQPRPVRVGHHLHAPGQIIRAVRLGVPVLLTVRPPEDTVLSLVVREPYVTIPQGLHAYARFHERLLALPGRDGRRRLPRGDRAPRPLDRAHQRPLRHRVRGLRPHPGAHARVLRPDRDAFAAAAVERRDPRASSPGSSPAPSSSGGPRPIPARRRAARAPRAAPVRLQGGAQGCPARRVSWIRRTPACGAARTEVYAHFAASAGA